jgi:hypothetical protein
MPRCVGGNARLFHYDKDCISTSKNEPRIKAPERPAIMNRIDVSNTPVLQVLALFGESHDDGARTTKHKTEIFSFLSFSNLSTWLNLYKALYSAEQKGIRLKF